MKARSEMNRLQMEKEIAQLQLMRGMFARPIEKAAEPAATPGPPVTTPGPKKRAGKGARRGATLTKDENDASGIDDVSGYLPVVPIQ